TFYSLDPEVDHFLGSDRVRFVGINTPEMTPTPEPWAVQATQHLRNILENAEVIYIMHDPQTGINDTYGRKLGLVWADGILVNLEMVRMGFSASTYDDPDQRLVFNGI
ncbi:thermonuclease family protein, partial [Arthrospira platensis SPKY1]|nr:thermonuclease family protein [Arthrospira platensis SPKY1]